MKIDFSKLDLQDALDLAILIEEEAAERYQEFSRLTGGRYEGDAGDVFARMAANEAKHGQQLAERRRELFGDAASRVDRSMIWEVEAPDYHKPRVFMSARQALEVAAMSEKKAEDYFTAALEQIQDGRVRELFEELRDEEKEHHALLLRHMEGLPAGPDVEEDEADEPSAH